MNSSEYLLQVRNLKIYYYTYEGVVKAVDGVSFNIKRGEALGIAGESSCGKSTLAYGLLRIVPIPGKIVEGKVIFDGTDILQLPESEFKRRYRWKRISMVFQGAMNSLDPVKNIGKQIADVILTHEENISKSEAYRRATELLKLVGIDPARAKSYPHELSGGMKQRVVIAMALALNPDLLIADEPTTALDVVVQAQIINLLKDLKEKLRMSLILITHDLSIIAEIADKVAIMYAGKIVELGKMEDIYEDPKHPYTSKLLRSIPRLRGKASLERIPSVVLTLNMADAILTEAGLSFLGFVVVPPTPDWGFDLRAGQPFLPAGYWWPITFPGFFILLLSLGFGLIGEGLNDMLAGKEI